MSDFDRGIYRRAADVLAKRGHCKWALCDEEGRVCLNGALNVACHGSAEWRWGHDCMAERATDEFAAVIDSLSGAVAFNNADGTTPEDVQLLLKYAAADELETWRSLYGNQP